MGVILIKIAHLATPALIGIPASAVTQDVTYYWGVLATFICDDWGEIVLAEHTQTFNKSDISYFFPLMKDAERRLGFRPPFGADAVAFDAHYVYDYFDEVGGFAAVPYVAKGGHPIRLYVEYGLPLCDAGLPMPLKSSFNSNRCLVPHRGGRYACPLLYPEATGQKCDHEKWAKGGGVTTS